MRVERRASSTGGQTWAIGFRGPSRSWCWSRGDGLVTPWRGSLLLAVAVYNDVLMEAAALETAASELSWEGLLREVLKYVDVRTEFWWGACQQSV